MARNPGNGEAAIVHHPEQIVVMAFFRDESTTWNAFFA